jgi:hypothetical protein
LLACASACFAQNSPAADSQPQTFAVIAFASSERVRFTAPSSVVQMRLEVYDAAGRKLFDNELRGGNVLDWYLQDGQAARLADGTYLCVVTVKDRAGRLTQRLGSVLVAQGNASVQAVTAAQLTAQQAAAVGPIEEQAGLSVGQEDERRTATALAYNGAEGQLMRSQAARSSRLIHFLIGKAAEQTRLSAANQFGQSGADRALLSRPLLPTAKRRDSSGESATTLGLAQALNKMSIEGNLSVGRNYSGTAAPTNGMIVEGNVGIGTPTPSAKLEVNGSIVVQGCTGCGSGTSQWVTTGSNIYFNTGDVGIGTPNPTGLLDVEVSAPSFHVNAVLGINSSFGDPGLGGATGVRGVSALGNGVAGISDGGYGVLGITSAAHTVTNAAVYGLSKGDGGIGVFGEANTGNAWGVYGRSTSATGYAGYFDGKVYATGTITQNSDIRLKRDIAKLSYGLREVLQLRPVTWHWKDKPEGKLNLGLVAQQVEPIIPELIEPGGKDADQTLGINYIGLVPVVIKAIQEQQREIEQLKGQVRQLKASARRHKKGITKRTTAGSKPASAAHP